MTFRKMEKGSFFATRPVNQMSITCFLLEVGSSMIALFKALIWLYNTYRVGSPILDFIKIILVTKYVIKSIKSTDPVTKLFL